MLIEDGSVVMEVVAKREIPQKYEKKFIAAVTNMFRLVVHYGSLNPGLWKKVHSRTKFEVAVKELLCWDKITQAKIASRNKFVYPKPTGVKAFL